MSGPPRNMQPVSQQAVAAALTAAASSMAAARVPPNITDADRQRVPSPHSRPGSSDGSTTVSATSSPGIDQQEEREDLQKSIQMKMNREISFQTVEECYQPPPPPPVSVAHFSHATAVATTSSSNGHHPQPEDIQPPQRKKPRK